MTYAAPLVRLPLNETTGSVAFDSSGNARHANHFGAPTISTEGVTYGVGKYTKIDEGAWARLTTQITVAAWVKSSSNAGTNTIASRFDNTTLAQEPWLLDTSGGQARFLLRKDSATRYDAAGGSGVNNGVWHRIVGTYDGTAVRVYLDGTQVGSAAYTGGTIQASTMDQGTLIGARESSFSVDGANYFPGMIRDFVMDDVAWSPAEVSADFTGTPVSSAVELTLAGATGTPSASFSLTTTAPAVPSDLTLAATAKAATGSLTLDVAPPVGLGVELTVDAVARAATGSLRLSLPAIAEASTDAVDRSNGRTRVCEWAVEIEPPVASATRDRGLDESQAYSISGTTLVDGRPT